MLSQDYLKQRLDYDPETGVLKWKNCSLMTDYWNRKFAGRTAGHIRYDGYSQIYVDNRKYFTHRIIWLLIHGSLPTQIDHINRDKSDNRLVNLREVTQSQNNLNRRALPSKTGQKHIKITKHKTFAVQISRGRGNPVEYVGTFKSLDEAVKARDLYLNND